MPKGIYTRGTIIRNPHSEETRLKIGLAHLGKTISDETKLKLSLVKMGRKYPNRKRYSKGITKIDKVCLFCKNPFQTDCFMPNKKFCNQVCVHKALPHNHTQGMKGSEKQKQMMRERTGEKHFAWIKDRTIVMEKHRLRGTTEWKNWRMFIFSRDKYTCQECKEVGGVLEPHHIIPLRVSFERIFDTSNGITLCRSCHQKTIFKEELFYEKYFGIIDNIIACLKVKI